MKILRSRIYELERSRIEKERSQDRKTKIGTEIDLREYVHIIFHKVELQITE